MPVDFSKGSLAWICMALDILVSINPEAEDGVSTVEEIANRYAPDFSGTPNDEEALVLAESCAALRRMVAVQSGLNSLVIDKQSRKMGYNPDGLNAAVFTGRAGRFIVFRGTAAGEWNDNAVALLGKKQTNAYNKYDKKGRVIGAEIKEEYISTQQAQALDYFNRVMTELGWQGKNSVIVTGHSKGGNKAQLITIKSPIVKECYAFCGQGFSEEALDSFREELGEAEFAERTEKIKLISSYNDFVNVLGDRIAAKHNIFYLDTNEIASVRQYHELASMVSGDGGFLPQRARGEMSIAGEKMWDETRNSSYRQAVCLAVMTLCSHYFGNGLPINGEYISNRTLYSGGRAAMSIVIRSIANILLHSGADKMTEEDKRRLSSYYDIFVDPEKNAERKSYFGKLVDRAVEKIRSRKPKEDAPKDVHTGTEEPFFSIDADMLHLSARRIANTREKISKLYREIELANGEQPPRGADLSLVRLMNEDARLWRCERDIDETASEFELADEALAKLAGFVI